MNRPMIVLADLAGAPSLLLLDSAVKGTALLLLAAVAALVLRRDSAARRHLAWLLAIVALLLTPALSSLLPTWRVLPEWASLRSTESDPGNSPSIAPAAVGSGPAVRDAESVAGEHSAAATGRATVAAPGRTSETSVSGVASRSSAGAPVSGAPAFDAESASSARNANWLDVVTGAWAVGAGFLLLRLIGARWLLGNLERQATAAGTPGTRSRHGESRITTDETEPSGAGDRVVGELEAACRLLGVRRPVVLLFHSRKTIPMVWGVFRVRLLLPAVARRWESERLRSVLLHELAHVRRHDPLVQLLTQIACALHWFNPLAWYAAWRLEVERERACDDLVLASGVRPSAYASHLLDVVTELASMRGTRACGLAMARPSALESRLAAVLGKNLDRRGVSVALAALALVLAAAVAVPIAMLGAADFEPPRSAAARKIGRISTGVESVLRWGDPVGGLRMALAWPPTLGDETLGKEPYFELVVQNVSERAMRFTAGAASPNARKMVWREGERTLFLLSDEGAREIDWRLEPGECGALRMFSQEERDQEGRTVSALLASDLAGGTRYHAVAVLEVARAPADAWKGKLVTGPTRAAADVAAGPEPKHKEARALYDVWRRHARANGDIPGALIGDLAGGVKQFIKYNPTWETVPKLEAFLPRLDAAHDWKASDAVRLLDEVAAVQDSPLGMAAEKVRTILAGEPLPAKFANVRWGEAAPSGLRAAWVLEPAGAEYRLGAALRARLIVHNGGRVPVVLQAPTWYQGEVRARDAQDAEVEVSGIEWTTLPRLLAVRLAPGEFLEIRTPGVGLGPRAGQGPWAGPRIGSSVLAKPGGELTLVHGLVPLDGSEVGVREADPHVIGAGWWLAHIRGRLARELPLPADAAERTRLLVRVVRELFAVEPTADEIAAFTADRSPAAVDSLAKRLAARPDAVEFSGKLATAPVRFRTLPADPQADRLPRVVLGPGEYPLSGPTAKRGAVTLKIVGRAAGDRRTNDARLVFDAAEATGKQAPEARKVDVPDGWGGWAIVVRPGAGRFYLLHRGAVREIDYDDPAKITDQPTDDLPAEFRAEVKRQLDIHDVSAETQAEVFAKPAAPATPVK